MCSWTTTMRTAGSKRTNVKRHRQRLTTCRKSRKYRRWGWVKIMLAGRLESLMKCSGSILLLLRIHSIRPGGLSSRSPSKPFRPFRKLRFKDNRMNSSLSTNLSSHNLTIKTHLILKIMHFHINPLQTNDTNQNLSKQNPTNNPIHSCKRTPSPKKANPKLKFNSKSKNSKSTSSNPAQFSPRWSAPKASPNPEETKSSTTTTTPSPTPPILTPVAWKEAFKGPEASPNPNLVIFSKEVAKKNKNLPKAKTLKLTRNPHECWVHCRTKIISLTVILQKHNNPSLNKATKVQITWLQLRSQTWSQWVPCMNSREWEGRSF